jgi:hypothetical protein
MRNPRGVFVVDGNSIKADKFLLVVHGTAAEAAKAKDILSATRPAELVQHTLEAAKQPAKG